MANLSLVLSRESHDVLWTGTQEFFDLLIVSCLAHMPNEGVGALKFRVG